MVLVAVSPRISASDQEQKSAIDMKVPFVQGKKNMKMFMSELVEQGDEKKPPYIVPYWHDLFNEYVDNVRSFEKDCQHIMLFGLGFRKYAKVRLRKAQPR